MVSLTFWLGYRYGNSVVETIRDSQSGLTIIVLLVIAIGLTFYLLRRRRRKLLKEAEKYASSEDAENTSKNDRIVA